MIDFEFLSFGHQNIKPHRIATGIRDVYFFGAKFKKDRIPGYNMVLMTFIHILILL
jgi:hypothetical protein